MDIPRSKRIQFKVIARCGPDSPPLFSSFITNLSATGIHVQSRRNFEAGTKLHLTIEGEEHSFIAEGTVAWQKDGDQADDNGQGMGIEFTSMPQELLYVYRKKLAEG